MKAIKYLNLFFITPLIVCFCVVGCNGQKTFGEQYLRLEKVIPLPGVKGRIDHLDINLKNGVVYVAALGNNTLEAVDLQQSKVLHSIEGLAEPQGVGYIPRKNEIFVANGGNGDCYFYDANTFEKTGSVHLSSDADDVRYDSIEGKIYVGYGEGGIAIIDADSHRQTGDVELTAHPEGFQVDRKRGEIFINVPDVHEIAVANRASQKTITHWKMNVAAANFPMALDDKHNRLFVVCRKPARLIVVDNTNGRIVSASECVGDADDVYYDDNNKRIYVSGGEGYINIFADQEDGTFKEIGNIPTGTGARTSLFAPALRLFIVAARATTGQGAKLMIYKALK